MDILTGLEKQFSDYYNAGDAAGAANMYSEDGVLVVPNMAMLKGRAAITKCFEDMMSKGIKTLKVEVQSAQDGIGDNSCLELSFFTFSLANGDVAMQGRWMTFWQKDKDGKWLCKLDTLSPHTAKE